MLVLPFLECCGGKLDLDVGGVTSSVVLPDLPGSVSLPPPTLNGEDSSLLLRGRLVAVI
jgi:hypothetical protein